MKWKPINDTSTIEIVKSSNDQNLEGKIVRDPKNQISPRPFRVIRTEKNIKTINMTICFTIMTAAIIFFVLAYLKVGPFVESYWGYLIAFGVTAAIFLALGIKNLIENIQWSNTVKRYREALELGDKTSSNTFHLAYRRIVLKGVDLTWCLIFVLTYLGLITAIVYGIYSKGMTEINYEPTFKLKLNWKEILDNGFGNTPLFCLISTIVMALLIGFYVAMRLIDKKRLADLSDFLGERSVDIHEQIENSRRDRNKLWMRAYLVIVFLTILLPLALLTVAIWRMIVKRKKQL
ncbi:hypothetical protein KQ874_02890 [Mycoplasma sp. ES3157-GEN-MYC]|uniref:Uncharacterized protein n=1 Tax=Mycoplasma miroungigenitalium TaxID=754515 RepID=A0A6M4JBV7_9MOLU|nr:hypothetical protein [Mycoplasma miroungigenitalium]MBU4690624.1 hypothetical protein [Mycoplasma miroungigenitalium]MBU4691891.1 hypothetical protein [Mycoplasma miroungigenitalium]QJR43748.1 hypothetical protein HLA87_03090 [Mycoplasma miroungigenitalium]